MPRTSKGTELFGIILENLGKHLERLTTADLRALGRATRSANASLSIHIGEADAGKLSEGIRALVGAELRLRRAIAHKAVCETLTSNDLWPPNDGGGYRG